MCRPYNAEPSLNADSCAGSLRSAASSHRRHSHQPNRYRLRGCAASRSASARANGTHFVRRPTIYRAQLQSDEERARHGGCCGNIECRRRGRLGSSRSPLRKAAAVVGVPPTCGRNALASARLVAASWASAKASWYEYVDITGRFCLVVSVPKTKLMTVGHDDRASEGLAFSRQQQGQPDLVRGETCLDTAEVFNFLGSRVQSDGEAGAEVAARMQSAAEAWHRLHPSCFACKYYVRLPTRSRMFSTSVLSRLLYGCETWGFTKRQLRTMTSWYNQHLRYLAGFNLWKMEERGITDSAVRQKLRAPPLQQILDRAVLRWLGHCARM